MQFPNCPAKRRPTHLQIIFRFHPCGYCTDKAKTTLKVSTVTLTVPRTSTEEWVYEGDQGVENSWGGSVDMYSMFTRLQDIRIASTTNNNYVYDRYVEVGVNGQTNVLSESRATFYTNYTNPLMGSFVFSSNSSQYTYLHGGTTIFETRYSYGDDEPAYIISNGSGRYLAVNGTTVTSTTDPSSAASGSSQRAKRRVNFHRYKRIYVLLKQFKRNP